MKLLHTKLHPSWALALLVPFIATLTLVVNSMNTSSNTEMRSKAATVPQVCHALGDSCLDNYPCCTGACTTGTCKSADPPPTCDAVGGFCTINKCDTVTLTGVCASGGYCCPKAANPTPVLCGTSIGSYGKCYASSCPANTRAMSGTYCATSGQVCCQSISCTTNSECGQGYICSSTSKTCVAAYPTATPILASSCSPEGAVLCSPSYYKFQCMKQGNFLVWVSLGSAARCFPIPTRTPYPTRRPTMTPVPTTPACLRAGNITACSGSSPCCTGLMCNGGRCFTGYGTGTTCYSDGVNGTPKCSQCFNGPNTNYTYYESPTVFQTTCK